MPTTWQPTMTFYSPTEHQTQAAILDYLQRLPGAEFWRNNTGGARIQKYDGTQGFIRFGKKGSGDIIGCYRGRFVSIEVKSPIGKVSPDQQAFGESITRAGGVAVVARSVDDVVALMKEIAANTK